MAKSIKPKLLKSGRERAKASKINNQADEPTMNEKLDKAIDFMMEISRQLNEVINTVNSLQQDINSLKPTINAKTIEPSRGPFPQYHPIDRNVPRPSTNEIIKSTGGKAHSLQFTSNLYVNLIEKAIGPSSESGLDYKAMVKEAVLITKAIISNIKVENRLDPSLRWSKVDPIIKLNAYQTLEAATEHLLPLKTCAEFWGAHVLISNFWLKRKKQRDNTKQSEEAEELDTNRRKVDAFSIPFLTCQ